MTEPVVLNAGGYGRRPLSKCEKRGRHEYRQKVDAVNGIYLQCLDCQRVMPSPSASTAS